MTSEQYIADMIGTLGLQLCAAKGEADKLREENKKLIEKLSMIDIHFPERKND